MGFRNNLQVLSLKTIKVCLSQTLIYVLILRSAFGSQTMFYQHEHTYIHLHNQVTLIYSTSFSLIIIGTRHAITFAAHAHAPRSGLSNEQVSSRPDLKVVTSPQWRRSSRHLPPSMPSKIKSLICLWQSKENFISSMAWICILSSILTITYLLTVTISGLLSTLRFGEKVWSLLLRCPVELKFYWPADRPSTKQSRNNLFINKIFLWKYRGVQL